MKRSVELMVLATVVLLFGFATSASAQRLTGVSLGSPSGGPGGSTSGPNWGAGRVFTPASSLSAPSPSGPTFHTNVQVMIPNGFQPESVAPPFSGYGYNTPASIACVYGLVPLTTASGYCNPNDPGTDPTGGSQTIAIVDAYDDPWIAPDLAYFSAAFGLPFSPSQFSVVYENGTEPPQDKSGGWELEESLDVEYAHAIAPAPISFWWKHNPTAPSTCSSPCSSPATKLPATKRVAPAIRARRSKGK